MWLSITPQLSVSDVRAAQEFYRDVLGWQILWIWNDDFGCVGSGNSLRIYFTRDEPVGKPMTCCIDVEDADAVHAGVVARGAKIVSELETKPWGMREFTVEDPNGHLLRVGQGVERVDRIPEFRTGD